MNISESETNIDTEEEIEYQLQNEYEELIRRHEQRSKNIDLQEKIELLKSKDPKIKKKKRKYEVISSDTLCKELQIYQIFDTLDENQVKLLKFTVRCVTDENNIYPMKDVELTIDFSFNGSKSFKVKSGTGIQKVRAFFDENNAPIFRWEKSSTRRKLWKFGVEIFQKKSVASIIENTKTIFGNAVNALNTLVLYTTLKQWKTSESQKATNIIKEALQEDSKVDYADDATDMKTDAARNKIDSDEKNTDASSDRNKDHPKGKNKRAKRQIKKSKNVKSKL